jgi:hypothetical protein
MTETQPTSRKIEIDLDQIRVVETENAIGDPIIYVEIMGIPVLYSTPDTLRCWSSLNALHKDIASAVWCGDLAVRGSSLTTGITGILNQARHDPGLAKTMEARYVLECATPGG